ncbi:MAG: VWA domain-containing protein, partial [Verrucomicrobiae bacterium]|nr:VWA domain-containing protein [Verrucomicrobiae bacterium]
ARQDIALILDASTSMGIVSDGATNFERAVEEARTLIKRAPRGHAFSLIVGGPSPSALVLDPTTDRAVLETALNELTPLDGAMTTYQAFTLASLSLARGANPAKQIVILTDEQNVGWEIGQSGRWNFLRDTFKNLPSEPQIMVRRMPMPDFVRNLAVTDVRLSREIVGIDRPVTITATVANTGNEAVTPTALVLKVDDGRDYRDASLGQLRPGEEQVVVFTHQFGDAGAHSLSLTLEVEDDIASDNTGWSALNVANELKVLIVEGRPSARALDRAAAFAAVALAPSALTLDPSLEANLPGTSDPAADDFDPNYDPTLDPVRFLVDPQVVELPDLGVISDFSTYDTVILADVPRLSGPVASALARYVRDGGGLLVAAGMKAQGDFYNAWKTEDDSPFLPATIGDVVVAAANGSGGVTTFSPSAQTLTHPALAKVADPSKSDFSGTVITNYRPQVIPEALAKDASVGARLNNGEILLSSRQAGRGQVVLLGIPLDLSGGNLVTRQAFLPFIHELVYHLADPAAYQLNLDPGWEVNLGLAGKRGRALGEGLIGRYFASHNATEPVYTRQDPAIQFNWMNGSPAPGVPADGFKVEWTGKIQMPDPKRLTFQAEVDDHLEIFIDGKSVVQFNQNTRERRFSGKVEKNRWYDFRAVFKEDGGEAKAILKWEAENLPSRIIPPSSFRTFSGETGETGRESSLATFPVKGPDGKARVASLSSKDGGSVLKLQGQISSGLYQLTVPEDQAPFFSDFLREGTSEIPFTVKRDAAESRLVRLTDSDYAFLENFVTLSKPQTLEELIGFLNGNQFGQELWKYLALGAFVFLLLEIVLSRWIAQSRRMGEEIKIQFESKDAPSNAFREQLARFGKA